jgi:LmbE family N-acetylglucosaminyl deacetylase
LKTLIKKSFIQIVYGVLQYTTKQATIKSGSILIIAPHPDDEIIGTGGLIIKKLREGCKVNIVFLTDGECSGASPNQEETKQARISLSEKIAIKLGVPPENLYRMHLPDAFVPKRGEPGFADAVTQLAHLIDKIDPSAIFATHFLDHWPFDHVACSQIATEAVIKLCKPNPELSGGSSVNQPSKKPELWLYWVWAWYFFRPWKSHKLNFKNLYRLDINNEIALKRELMDIYLQPRSPEGKPWSGVLPVAMIFPFSKPIEIIEKIKY